MSAGDWVAFAIVAAFAVMVIVVLPASLAKLRAQGRRAGVFFNADEIAAGVGETLDEVRRRTRPSSIGPGWREDELGGQWYSAAWLDDWGFDDDPA